MCQGFSHFPGFSHHFDLAKLATTSIRVKFLALISSLGFGNFFMKLRKKGRATHLKCISPHMFLGGVVEGRLCPGDGSEGGEPVGQEINTCLQYVRAGAWSQLLPFGISVKEGSKNKILNNHDKFSITLGK